ncbi:MAG: tRNA pseudouridine(55) synthase TruB [Planctomycetaceae bacterium]|nr:tRNA pseudouridine(55) synthase TruB [Planctomycetaceae bacterium]
MSTPLSGILNVAKPAGITSRRVVDRVERLVRPAKAGHAGTLDPLATGVLVVCVGQATRLIEYVQRAEKTYEATFLLGRTSDTEDVEGAVVELVDPRRPTPADIEQVLPTFLGTILQRPPSYSALKVQGRRAYDLARAGKEVELAPRPVEIHGIELLGYDYPELRLRIRCGSGTYVRSLGRDIAAALGTGAVMSALVRTAIGEFRLTDACDVEQLTLEELPARLQPPSRAVVGLPSIMISEAERRSLHFGQAIERVAQGATDELVALTEQGELASILRPAGERSWKPKHNFAVPSRQ